MYTLSIWEWVIGYYDVGKGERDDVVRGLLNGGSPYDV